MQLSLFPLISQFPKPITCPPEEKIRSVLGPRLPPAAVEMIVAQIMENPISIIVTRNRFSKSGDFRAAHKKKPARITVNGNLNPYAFLITLVHEIAHHHEDSGHTRSLQKFSLRRKSRPLPHGKDWKDRFRLLMLPYLNNKIFPFDILPVLSQYMENPKASSSVDHQLTKVLNNYDPPDTTIRLEELPFDAVFSIHGIRYFRKKEKLRKRYRCICLKTNRVYLVSANAPVNPAES